MAPLELSPGAVYLEQYLPGDEQVHLATRCLELGEASAGFYTPVVRGRYPMSVRMLCLGRHWNASTYRYEEVRSDVDGQPVPALPAGFESLARAIAHAAGYPMRPDICIVNWYRTGSRLGLHQDKDESEASLTSGAPVVSISLGDTAKFLFGGLRRGDPVETILLRSGDVFVFGGPARLNYHGVARILPNTAPVGLGFEGRLNLTFRQF
ncbi:MAG TPA: alpha-ketoglutarate-dependent dioxygenase AlkB [Vicinamibacterales bacterium]|nr:alpha-ketoglutarate-dependent dioxygenase AlkB [Vicinamibacterales bacterium]